MNKVLMIAFHYPPYCGGSGIQRTLKFSRYLPDHGWQPIILTASPRAYSQVGYDQVNEIPAGVSVTRAFALDTTQHLSIRGSYLRWMALPDRWISWWLGAVPGGLRVLRKYRPDLIWSTYPIATAHLIGLTLHRLTGSPWIADFRDSMTEDNYPRDPLTRRSYLWIEKQAIRHSSRLVFTTSSTREMYLNRYSELPPERCLVIPNGYDEEDFQEIITSNIAKNLDHRPIRLLHAGVIYPDDRDPRPFFKALSRLKKEGLINTQSLRVDLRGSGSESYYSAILKDLGIGDLVYLLPEVPYRQALQDCACADALLLFQAASCNHQIPAKVYEYFRLRKPILALTPIQGDTGGVLKEMGGATIVDLADEQAICCTVPRFLSAIRNGTHLLPDNTKIERYARKRQTLELAKCLSQLINTNLEGRS